MTDRLAGSYTRFCLGRMVINLVISFVILGAIGCLVLGIALIPDDVLPGDAGLFLFIAGLVGIIFVGILAAAVYAFRVRAKRIGLFDTAFAPFGLEPQGYLISGRQYRGTFQGRQVNVYFYISGGRFLRVPTLQIYVGANIRTRLGIGTRNALTTMAGDLLKHPPLDLNDSDFADLLLYPLDERWSRDLFRDHHGREAILRLAGARDGMGVHGLEFAPESVRFQLRHFEIGSINPEIIRNWMDDLFLVAEMAEAISPPMKTAVAGSMEKTSRTDRNAQLPVIIGVVLALVLCPLVCVGAVLAVYFLAGGFS